MPNPLNKPYINHKDGDTHNNSLKNLEWCTASENNKDAFNRGRKPVISRAKINYDIASQIRLIKMTTKLKNIEIGELFGLKQPEVSLIINYKRWLKPN